MQQLKWINSHIENNERMSSDTLLSMLEDVCGRAFQNYTRGPDYINIVPNILSRSDDLVSGCDDKPLCRYWLRKLSQDFDRYRAQQVTFVQREIALTKRELAERRVDTDRLIIESDLAKFEEQLKRLITN